MHLYAVFSSCLNCSKVVETIPHDIGSYIESVHEKKGKQIETFNLKYVSFFELRFLRFTNFLFQVCK